MRGMVANYPCRRRRVVPLPGPAFLACLVACGLGVSWPAAASAEERAPGAEPHRLKLLVAEIGEVDPAMTRRVIATLNRSVPADPGLPKLDVSSMVLIRKLKQGKVPLSGVIMAITERSHEIIREQSLDLLVWLMALPDGNKYRLRFISGNQTTVPFPPAPPHYLDIEPGFDGEIAAAAQGLLVLATAPALARRNHYLANALPPLVEKVRGTAQKKISTGKTNAQLSLQLTYAAMVSGLSDAAGDRSRLDEAISAHRKALKGWKSNRFPRSWAWAQWRLGEALARRHFLAPDGSDIAGAVKAFRAVRRVNSQERYPHQWAVAGAELGAALTKLGAQKNDAELVHEATAVLRGAGKVITRQDRPVAWALLQHRLGMALDLLGTLEGDEAQFEAAAEVFRAALAVLDRRTMAMQWALIQSDLGTTLARLDGRRSEALAAYRASVSVLNPEQHGAVWGSAQIKVGFQLMDMAGREGGTGRYREAIAALRAGLTRVRQNESPELWANACNALGSALHLVGQTEQDSRLIREAVANYRKSLEVITHGSTPGVWAVTTSNLGEAYGDIGVMEKDRGQIAKGINFIRRALEVWTKDADPAQWAYGSELLGKFLVKLSAHGGDSTHAAEAVGLLNEVIAWNEERGDTASVARLRDLLVAAEAR